VSALTERQEQIVRVMRDAIADHGQAPTMSEIGQAVGLSSVSTVLHHLRILEQQGIVRRNGRRARCYQPTH
jgi:repressor LexA